MCAFAGCRVAGGRRRGSGCRPCRRRRSRVQPWAWTAVTRPTRVEVEAAGAGGEFADLGEVAVGAVGVGAVLEESWAGAVPRWVVRRSAASQRWARVTVASAAFGLAACRVVGRRSECRGRWPARGAACGVVGPDGGEAGGGGAPGAAAESRRRCTTWSRPLTVSASTRPNGRARVSARRPDRCAGRDRRLRRRRTWSPRRCLVVLLDHAAERSRACSERSGPARWYGRAAGRPRRVRR